MRIPIQVVDSRASNRPAEEPANDTAEPDRPTEGPHDPSPPLPDPEPVRPPATADAGIDWAERWRRTAADLENLRRTADRRVQDAVWQHDRDRLERWLDLGDAIDRARRAAATAPVEWREGWEAVTRLFDDLMAKSGASRIGAAERFDPTVHEAVAVVPDPGRPDGTVREVVRDGWRLGERVLRAAAVVVVRNA